MNNNKPVDPEQQAHTDFIQQEWERLQNEAIAAQRWRLENEKSHSANQTADHVITGPNAAATGRFQLPERWSLKMIFVVLLTVTLGYGLAMWIWL